MSDKLTERDRWFIKHAFTAGYNTIYREIEHVLHEPSPDDWLEKRLRSINKTVEESLLEDAPKPAPWRPIETAPEGTMALFCDMKATEAKDWCFVDWIAGGTFAGSTRPMATHWMPLPEPPTPAPKTLIDSMDAWAADEATGIDEGKA